MSTAGPASYGEERHSKAGKTSRRSVARGLHVAPRAPRDMIMFQRNPKRSRKFQGEFEKRTGWRAGNRVTEEHLEPISQ